MTTEPLRRPRRENTRQSSVLESLAHHWRLAAAMVIVGILAGLIVGAVRPPVWTAEMRLMVGSGQLTASKNAASNYARLITPAGVGDYVPPDDVRALTASPIPDSNVIRIEATSRQRDAAEQSVVDAAEALIQEVTLGVVGEDEQSSARADLLDGVREVARAEAASSEAFDEFKRLSSRRNGGDDVTEAEVDASLEAYANAQAELRSVELQQSALESRFTGLAGTDEGLAIKQIGQGASVVEHDRLGAIQRYGLLGGALGGLLAIAAAVLSDARTSARANRYERP